MSRVATRSAGAVALATALALCSGCRESRRAPAPAPAPAPKASTPPAAPRPADCAGIPPLTAAALEKTAAEICGKSKLVRTADGLELWETPHGPIWVLAKDFGTMCHVFGEQAAEIYGDAVRGVHKNDIVLDCGAHFGGFVKTALARGAKKVVAIDIAPEVLESLRRTFKEEIAAGKVVVYGKGVWDRDDEMKLERSDHAWADHAGAKGSEVIKMTTIDKIVAELGLPRVDFIKMDIEGAERNALAGAKQTLAKHQPRMAIAAYHKPDDFSALPAAALSAQPAYRACLANAKLGWGFATLFFEAGRAPAGDAAAQGLPSKTN